MEVRLSSEIIDKLSHRGIMAYVAVSLAGDVEASTASLASLVRVQTAVMLEGLKELAVEAPTLVKKGSGEGHNNKWWCGGFALDSPGLQILDSSRYRQFVDDLKKYWDFMNPGLPFQMGAKDGAAIRGFLRDHPKWTAVDWLIALRNRARSPVVKSAPLFTWVSRLSDYAAGPLNEFGRPQEGTGKHGQAISVEEANREARQRVIGVGATA